MFICAITYRKFYLRTNKVKALNQLYFQTENKNSIINKPYCLVIISNYEKYNALGRCKKLKKIRF